jgi:hypothetical protein
LREEGRKRLVRRRHNLIANSIAGRTANRGEMAQSEK